MKLFILGGTGRTGQHLISQALEQGHEVVALVRNPSKLSLQNQKLTVITGDIFNSGMLAEKMKGADVVLSCLGVGDSLTPHDLIANATASIIPAMQSAGVKRIVFISAFGLGETYNQGSFMQKFFYKFVVNKVYIDKLKGEQQLRASNLDWILVYPTVLSNGKRTGHYRIGEQLPMKGVPKISRADVAEFLLKQVNSNEWLKKTAVISY